MYDPLFFIRILPDFALSPHSVFARAQHDAGRNSGD